MDMAVTKKNVLSYGVKEFFQIFAGTNSLRATSPPVKSLGKGGHYFTREQGTGRKTGTLSRL
ncbi:hypothetical protein, partial [Bilophila wadsworthia]|uniref:hypothetical protein n=1 Tax=Bilophila wadsworthia TaxID=35833 RepID=UPI003AB2530D